MTEPLTDRLLAILRYLGSGRYDLSDFQRTMIIAEGAFGNSKRLGVVRNELGVLSWRGLVEQSTLDPDRYRITDVGMEAAGI